MKKFFIFIACLVGAFVLTAIIVVIVQNSNNSSSSSNSDISNKSDKKETVGTGSTYTPSANDTVLDITSSSEGTLGYIGKYKFDIYTFNDDSVYIKFANSKRWILHTKNGGTVPEDATYGNALFKGTKKHPNVRVMAVKKK